MIAQNKVLGVLSSAINLVTLENPEMMRFDTLNSPDAFKSPKVEINDESPTKFLIGALVAICIELNLFFLYFFIFIFIFIYLFLFLFFKYFLKKIFYLDEKWKIQTHLFLF